MENRTKVVAIVQARMGATRLPNKMMLWLNGFPVIEWVFRRASQARLVDELAFAIPDTRENEVLGYFLEKLGAKVIVGDEADVVSRFHKAATCHEATHVVRICADNPLICGREIDRLITYYFAHAVDYAYNHVPRNNCYADGLGAEIASFAALDRIHREASESSEREHVFNYIWNHAHEFSIGTFDPFDDALACPDLRLDIDDYQDYLRMLRSNVTIGMEAREIVGIFKGLK